MGLFKSNVNLKKKCKCFLCDKKNNVLDFSNASFRKCLSMLLFRRRKKYNYHDILFTVESTEDFGYHTQFLQKITALKQKYKQEYGAEEYEDIVPII